MIKINLLPTKRKVSKKISELQQQMVLGGLIFVLFLMGTGSWWLKLNATISQLKTMIAAAEARIREQDALLKEVKNIEAERKVVQDKIAIIEQLKKNQSGPVRLLDEVSKRLPPGVNIVSLTEKGGVVNIDGGAFGNNDIVLFVDNLKSSPMVADIVLSETRLVSLEGVEIYSYKLQFKFSGN